jgi:putative chitinase
MASMIDRRTFFDAVRESVFGGALTEGQVEGTELLLDMWAEHYPDLIDAGMAYILASCFHESARTMQPVREMLASTDASAVRILDRAWAKGQLKGVRAPYWRSGWFGRGLIQITLKDNYRRMTAWLHKQGVDVDLVANRDLALDPEISARIAFEGIIHGLFRNGHWLAKYIDQDRADFIAARKIVNGPFRDDDVRIARHARAFLFALKAAHMAWQSGQIAEDDPVIGLNAHEPDIVSGHSSAAIAVHQDIQTTLSGVPDGTTRHAMALALAMRWMKDSPPDPATDTSDRDDEPAPAAGFLLPAPQRNKSMVEEKHPLASKTIQGALTALLGMALPVLAPLVGLQFTETDGQDALTAISQVVTAFGVLYSIYGRMVATRRISL